MKVLFIISMACVLAACTGCTKQNPDACCTDEADCQMIGLPNGTTCSDGLVCRGNQCIAETCSGASDCDAATPYCDAATMTCEEACTGDMECPGFGGNAADTFCVAGGCVQCRQGMDDCSGDTPICDASGACRGCQANTDCASDLCDISSGACVDMADVLYASAGGADTADCSQGTPCSITHAIASVTATKNKIVMAQGTYDAMLTIDTGMPMTIYGNNSIIDQRLLIEGGSKVTMQDLALNGFACYDTTTAPNSQVSLVRVQLGPNPTNMVTNYVKHCDLTLLETTLYTPPSLDPMNLELYDEGTITGDRCAPPAITIEASSTASVDAAVTFTNSLNPVVTRLLQGANDVAVTISFSSMFGIIGCPGGASDAGLSGVTFKYSNVIVHAGTDQPYAVNTSTGGPLNCFDHVIAYPQTGTPPTGVIVEDPLLADPANGDFHLMAGSPAIDAANAQIDHDYDGTLRPQGSGYDIGAYEYH